MNKFSILLLLTIVIIQGCQKEELLTSENIEVRFSTDTVMFDTVFTSIGSATRRFKIYNPNRKAIVIPQIYIGNSNSPFVINIDGISGNTIQNVRIEPGDSIFGFAQVKVDPTNQLSPLLIEDSIVVMTGTNSSKSIKLLAWGQDVHLIRDSVLTTQTWYNDKPYLIYGSAIVDSNQVLTIAAGCTIYFHNKAWMGVYGTLQVNGTYENPVIFRGDRLDKSNYAPPVPYDKIPGQWEGIRFANSSRGNRIEYAIIRNATFGLVVGIYNQPGKAELEISNSRVYNHYTSALFATGAKIKAWNCVFAQGEWASLMIAMGGNYSFYHCTFAAYPSFGVKSGYALYLSNYLVADTLPGKENTRKIFYGELEKAEFANCILYGEIETSIKLVSSNNHAFEYIFDHCLIKGTNDLISSSGSNRFVKSKISDKESASIFQKIDLENYYYDFRLNKSSPARESGSFSIASEYPIDLSGKSRIYDDAPDMGAYEYYPNQ
ncbi:MAG: hypothetical protein N2662_08560 [Bacteroidales bacterium]|nr:hypothetical protein [Bacteroidales bacterium]